jgi:hypothetical protein
METATAGAITVLVMGGYVAVVVIAVLVGKTVIDLIGDRVYGRTDNKKRPGRTRGA